MPAQASDLRYMERIHLNDALKKMDEVRYPESSESFSIVYLKCDRKRKTGGQWVKLDRAQKCGLPFNMKSTDMKGLVNLESGMKTAIHNQLIYEFNGAKIYK